MSAFTIYPVEDNKQQEIVLRTRLNSGMGGQLLILYFIAADAMETYNDLRIQHSTAQHTLNIT